MLEIFAASWPQLLLAYALIGWLTGGVLVWRRRATRENIFPRLIVALFLWWLLWLGVVWGLLCAFTLWVFDPDRGALALVRDLTREATRLGQDPPPPAAAPGPEPLR